MASNYVKLVEARKLALKKGKNGDANKLMEQIRELVQSGKVTEDEFTAGLYI